jgi:hypothetical protein
MALLSTQPLTEMSTRNVPGGKGRRLTTLWVFTTCYRDIFTFFIKQFCRVVGCKNVRIIGHLLATQSFGSMCLFYATNVDNIGKWICEV